ncbi:hypothetical protein [Luteimicrobium sp. DT211]|uniref:hypothetical protein n=1 Tax=Luteimicrobium sp. DT211 TaxID=3393412 RepID=UPI003CE7D19C
MPRPALPSPPGRSQASDTPGPHALAVARTVLVAVTSLVLAAGAHAVCGGVLPNGLGLVGVAAACALVGALCARARLRAAVTVPALLALQYVAHAAFAVLPAGPTTSPASPLSLAGHGGHLGHGGPVAPGATPPAGAGAAVEHAAGHVHGLAAGLTGTAADRAMLAAHLAATLAVAVLVVAGDAAATRTFTWWARVLPAVLAVASRPLLPRRRPVAAPPATSAAPRGRVVAGPLLRRGPPLAVA